MHTGAENGSRRVANVGGNHLVTANVTGASPHCQRWVDERVFTAEKLVNGRALDGLAG